MHGVPLLPAFLLLAGLVLAIFDLMTIGGSTSAGSRGPAYDGIVKDLHGREAVRPMGSTTSPGY